MPNPQYKLVGDSDQDWVALLPCSLQLLALCATPCLPCLLVLLSCLSCLRMLQMQNWPRRSSICKLPNSTIRQPALRCSNCKHSANIYSRGEKANESPISAALITGQVDNKLFSRCAVSLVSLLHWPFLGSHPMRHKLNCSHTNDKHESMSI